MPWSRSLFQQIYLHYPEGFLIAEEEGQIVGYAIFEIEDQGGLVGHLLNIGVDKNHRRRGIGSLLLNTILNNIIRSGALEVYLEVFKSNLDARRFYATFGFKEEKEIKNYYGRGEDGILMRLRLHER